MSAAPSENARTQWSGWPLTWWGAGLIVPAPLLLSLPGQLEGWVTTYFILAVPLSVFVLSIIWGRRIEQWRRLWEVPLALVALVAVSALISGVWIGGGTLTVVGVLVAEAAVVAALGVSIGTGLRQFSVSSKAGAAEREKRRRG